MSKKKERVPDFTLTAPPGILLGYIEVYVEAEGWLAKLLWRFIRSTCIRCNWSEIPATPTEFIEGGE